MRDFSIDLIWTKLQLAITVLGGWLGYFVGRLDGLLTALLILMVIDYITGIMCYIPYHISWYIFPKTMFAKWKIR